MFTEYENLRNSLGGYSAKLRYAREITRVFTRTLGSFGFNSEYVSATLVKYANQEWTIYIKFGIIITISIYQSQLMKTQAYFIYDEYINLSSLIEENTPFTDLSNEEYLDLYTDFFKSLGFDTIQKPNKLFALDRNITYCIKVTEEHPNGHLIVYIDQDIVISSLGLSIAKLEEKIELTDKAYAHIIHT